MTLDLEIENGQRAAMGSANRLKLGLFGANYSSGRAVTTVPERWSGSLPDCVRPAQMADRAGIEFMLPIGRWKGYDGDSDYRGATWETLAWAYGLSAKTERLTVFGTVNAPLIPPLIAAKKFVTADHIGEGRFGLKTRTSRPAAKGPRVRPWTIALSSPRDEGVLTAGRCQVYVLGTRNGCIPHRDCRGIQPSIPT
jgi:hypothetical protein